jgi:hypothetical protein
MAVDDDERRLLLAQMQKHRNQGQMFRHVGEIPGMEGVAIIHAGRTR